MEHISIPFKPTLSWSSLQISNDSLIRLLWLLVRLLWLLVSLSIICLKKKKTEMQQEGKSYLYTDKHEGWRDCMLTQIDS